MYKVRVTFVDGCYEDLTVNCDNSLVAFQMVINEYNKLKTQPIVSKMEFLPPTN